MMGQAPAVYVVGPFTQQIEHLRKGQRHKEIVGWCGIGNGEKHSGFPIPNAVKLHFIVAHNLPELGNVKGSQPSAAGNEDAFCCLAACQLVLFILLDGEAIRLALFQPHEHIVHGIEKILIVLFDLHAGNHIHQRIHVAVSGSALENNVGDQSAVQERFGLRPERISLFAVTLGIGYEGVNKL